MFILARMVENQQFKIRFINRFADLLNTVMLPERVKGTIDEIVDVISSEMPNDLERWDHSLEWWDDKILSMKDFVDRRPDHVRQHIIERFQLNGQARITIDVSPPSSATVRINTITAHSFPWEGIYLQDIPITLTVVPEPGFVFSEWTDPGFVSDNGTVTLDLSGGYSITANLE